MSEPKFTKGPWSLCGAERGGCCCFTVGSPHHPIADITHGEWGDEYVNIRLIDNPNGITKLAEAFMDHSWYGEVPDEQARANGYLIAASPEMYEALRKIRDSYLNDPSQIFHDSLSDYMVSASLALAKAEGVNGK